MPGTSSEDFGIALLPDPTARDKCPHDNADCAAERRTHEVPKHRTLRAGHFRGAGPLRGIPKQSNCPSAADGACRSHAENKRCSRYPDQLPTPFAAKR
jgi:hypothetical protein